MVIAALLAAATLALSADSVSKGRVVTDTLWSQSLGTRKVVQLYLPPSYETAPTRRYPWLIYLHGHDGSERDWVVVGRMAQTMDSLVAAGMPEMVVVMPDGDDGWWTTAHGLPDVARCRREAPSREGGDSYCVPWPHYDDYVAVDLLEWAEGRYRLRSERAARGIGGVSMGGYGAISLALRYPERFAAAASHSGVLDPREFAPPAARRRVVNGAIPDSLKDRTRRGLARTLDYSFGADTIGWIGRDPLTLLDRARARRAPLPTLWADIGTSDVFLDGNRAFRDGLQRRGVALEYAETPGGHDWDFWRSHLPLSLRWLAGQLSH